MYLSRLGSLFLLIFSLFVFPASFDGDRFCLYEVIQCIILEISHPKKRGFFLISFGLIWTTCIFLFCTDRLICPNKSVNASSRVNLHLQYYKNAYQQSRGNSRKTWQTINELTSKNSSSLSVREVLLDGNSINKCPKLSINISLALDLDLLVRYMPTQMIFATGSFSLAGTSVLNFNKLTAIRFLLPKLCISKVTGLDMISARLLRECNDLICYSLCEILIYQ